PFLGPLAFEGLGAGGGAALGSLLGPPGTLIGGALGAALGAGTGAVGRQAVAGEPFSAAEPLIAGGVQLVGGPILKTGAKYGGKLAGFLGEKIAGPARRVLPQVAKTITAPEEEIADIARTLPTEIAKVIKTSAGKVPPTEKGIVFSDLVSRAMKAEAPVVPERVMGAGVEGLQSTLLKAKEAKRARAAQLYEEAIKGGAEVAPEGMQGIQNNAMDVFAESFSEDLAPQTAKLLTQLTAPKAAITGFKELTPSNLGALDITIKRLNQVRKGGGIDAAAAGRVTESIYRDMDSLVDKALVIGDTGAIDKYKKARGLWTDYKRRFDSNAFIRSILERSGTEFKLSSEEALNKIMGVTNLGTKFGGSEAVKIIKSTLKSTDEGRQAWLGFQDEVAVNMIRRGSVSPKELTKMSPTVRKEMFNDTEWANIKQLAEDTSKISAFLSSGVSGAAAGVGRKAMLVPIVGQALEDLRERTVESVIRSWRPTTAKKAAPGIAEAIVAEPLKEQAPSTVAKIVKAIEQQDPDTANVLRQLTPDEMKMLKEQAPAVATIAEALKKRRLLPSPADIFPAVLGGLAGYQSQQ
ncbi:MAG: hypothetical protein ACREBU_09000, partial [Nitrososphaera sp.]